MFDDRRIRGDRRKQHNPDAIPPGGCRRLRERRDFFHQYHSAPWWLQTNYAEELQPPMLDQDAAARERHCGKNQGNHPSKNPGKNQSATQSPATLRDGSQRRQR